MEMSREFIPSQNESDPESVLLQHRLLEAVQQNDARALFAIRNEYAERYPDQMEGVTALLELPDFFAAERKLEEHRESRTNRLKNLERVTQYRFLLSKFILDNGHDKEWLTRFWKTAGHIAHQEDNGKLLHMLRTSTLSQVAVMRTFQALGQEASLSTPKEDAFNAVDVWTNIEPGKNDPKAVQIKSTEKKLSNPIVVETDTISFPAIESAGKFYNSKLAHDFDRFKMKLKEYGKPHGVLIVIRNSDFDDVTGEPRPEFIASVKEKLPQAEQAVAA